MQILYARVHSFSGFMTFISVCYTDMDLFSLAMAMLGCEVISTDQVEVVPLLKRNMERNTSHIDIGVPFFLFLSLFIYFYLNIIY